MGQCIGRRNYRFFLGYVTSTRVRVRVRVRVS